MSKFEVFRNEILPMIVIGFLLCVVIGGIVWVSYLLKLIKKQRKSLIKAKLTATDCGDFNTTLGHELRTPLFAVTASIKHLLDAKTKKAQLEDLQILEKASNYLVKLINDALLLKKFDSKGIKEKKEVFNILTLTDNVLMTVKKYAEEHEIAIHCHIAPTVPKLLKGDPLKITQILINLLSNAVKFGNKKPIILKIDCNGLLKDKCELMFSVQDHGQGIPTQDLKKVIKRFHQLQSIKKEFGSGLGLSIVVQLLEVMKSKLEINSKVGKGSLFSFKLKLKIVEKIDFIAPSTFSNLSKLKVLVVDDNLINQKLTIRSLEKKGIVGMACNSGEEAIELIKDNTFNAVFMDLHMPGMSGEETTMAIRNFNKKLPIIALTALDKTNHWKLLSKKGFNAILNKPYAETDLFTVLEKSQIAGKAL